MPPKREYREDLVTGVQFAGRRALRINPADNPRPIAPHPIPSPISCVRAVAPNHYAGEEILPQHRRAQQQDDPEVKPLAARSLHQGLFGIIDLQSARRVLDCQFWSTARDCGRSNCDEFEPARNIGTQATRKIAEPRISLMTLKD